MLDNEYVKSLEKRIEELERFIGAIKFDNAQNITFTDCSMGPVAFEKCKNVTVANNQMENGVFCAVTNQVSDSTIHNFESVKAKATIKNCEIHNYGEKE